nr:transcription elongation factor GreA [Ornithinicoccus hortensis]
MTEAAATSTNFLTKDAFERLSAELRHLSGEGRQDIARRIESAREEGDLKENGGYHAAKEEQGKMEARIRQLEHLLEHATVGEAPPDDGVVEPGMLVEVEMFGETETFLLGSREILGDGDDLVVYSERSPLGMGILGKSAGETTTYEAPNGKQIEVKIISAKPYSG